MKCNQLIEAHKRKEITLKYPFFKHTHTKKNNSGYRVLAILSSRRYKLNIFERNEEKKTIQNYALKNRKPLKIATMKCFTELHCFQI